MVRLVTAGRGPWQRVNPARHAGRAIIVSFDTVIIAWVLYDDGKLQRAAPAIRPVE